MKDDTVPAGSSGTIGPRGAEIEDARADHIRLILQDLRVIFRSSQSYSRGVEKKYGVSSTQLWVLWELHAAPGMKISEVAHALSIHRSTASNLLDKLEAKNLIERRRGGPDQRVVRVSLTEKGNALLSNIPGPARGPLTEALEKLPDQALSELESRLAEVVTALTIKDKAAGMKPIPDVAG